MYLLLLQDVEAASGKNTTKVSMMRMLKVAKQEIPALVLGTIFLIISAGAQMAV